jgi:hypothetical protein
MERRRKKGSKARLVEGGEATVPDRPASNTRQRGRRKGVVRLAQEGRGEEGKWWAATGGSPFIAV